MQYRVDLKSGNKISAIGYGGMRFPSFAETEKLILRAVELGVNFFDSAYIYPGSEEALGKIFSSHGLREKVFLATKMPLMYCKKPGDFEKYFNKQLLRLKTDYIDYYFMHMLVDVSQWEKMCNLGIIEFLAEKKKAGQIRQVGFSFHGKQSAFLQLLDVYDWDFCMIQYNYVDENYQAGAVGLRAANSKGLPVFIMNPLLGGTLAKSLPKEAEELFKADDDTLTLADRGFRWLFNQPEITCVLSGMNEIAQLEGNAACAKKSPVGCLDAAQMRLYSDVVDVFRNKEKVHCTGCNYCMPCHRGVNIPACFSAYNTKHSFGRIKGIKHYVMSNGLTAGEFSGASRCNSCRACERHCPQDIKIAEELRKVRRGLEPLPVRCVFKIARRFTGANKKAK